MVYNFGMKRSLRLRVILTTFLVLTVAALLTLMVALPRRERLHTGLIDATYNGQEAQAITLLKQGADANLRFDIQTRKPLPAGFAATISARLRGKTPEDQGNSVPLLALAVAYSRKALTEELLARGANVEAADGVGSTPLMYAVEHNERDILIDLLNAHADVNHQNQPGNTALYLAVNQKNPVSCALLLEHGANPNLANGEGQTPLDALAVLAADVHRQWLAAYINAIAAPKSAHPAALPSAPGAPFRAASPTPQMVRQFGRQLNQLQTLVSLLEKHGAAPSEETKRLLADSFQLDPQEAAQGLAVPRRR